MFGVSESGEVWRGAPLGVDTTEVFAPGRRLFEGAVELDDHGAFEDIVLFVCEAPQALSTLERQLAAQIPVVGCELNKRTIGKQR